MSTVLNWVKKNPTLLYAVLVSVLPLVAAFGVDFDQEKVLGVASAALTLLTGVVVRKANLNATAEARAEVPEGYLKLADFFPPAEYTVPDNSLSKGKGDSL